MCPQVAGDDACSPTLVTTLPGRVNIAGNPCDGNEGAHGCLSMAIPLFGGATIAPARGFHLGRWEWQTSASRSADAAPSPRLGRPGCWHYVREASFEAAPLSWSSSERMPLSIAALRALSTHSTEFRERIGAVGGLELGLWTELPRQSGLGGSSVLVLGALAALARFLGLCSRRHHAYFLSEVCQRAEEQELGTACGFSDRYLPMFGGLCYVSYHEKLHHHPYGQEPLATVEPLSAFAPDFRLVAAFTGTAHDSGDVHGPMRDRCLEAAQAVSPNASQRALLSITAAIGRCGWQAKLALLEHDFSRLGAILNENHRLVCAMMEQCGLKPSADAPEERFRADALEHGAWGAKLAGAGGGGSVLALVEAGSESAVVEGWRRLARDLGADQARVFITGAHPRGLRVFEGAAPPDRGALASANGVKDGIWDAP